MFGLSLRERLMNLVVCECRANINIYKEGIESLINNNIADENLIAIINNEYWQAVANACFNHIQNISPTLQFKISMLLLSPNQCGYDLEQSKFMAGAVYAICYYAVKGKIAKAPDCIALNNIQNQIMDNCLELIENEHIT